MSEVLRWSGNDTTNYSIANDEFREINEFAVKYKEIYIFGCGRIGKAFNKYLVDSGITIGECLTSADYEKMKILGKDNEKAIIVAVDDKFFAEVMPIINECFAEEKIYIPSLDTRNLVANSLSKDDWINNFWINIYVTNKCNLCCKSCSAFAPICKPDYYELDLFKKDLKRIKEMNFYKLNQFKFTGAEAMLHPDIMEMLAYARELFPKIKIEIYTNGMFIKNCTTEKLKALAKLDILFTITEYPLPNLNLEETYKRLNECGVSYCVIYSEEQKYFSKRPLRFEKDVPKYCYINCPRYKMCNSLFLFRGKFYKCIYGLSAQYVNEAFGKNLEVLENDYLDIYLNNAEDVFEYATHRIPFCSYCSPIEELVPWGISEKKIEEWS